MKSILKSVSAVLLTGLLALSACGSISAEPSDERPQTPKKVARKHIDPAHYKSEKKCVKRDSKGKCIKYVTKKKETDDTDWILVTSDGTSYDVEESEYNSVNVGDYWPK